MMKPMSNMCVSKRGGDMNKDSNWYRNKVAYTHEYSKRNYERINLTMPIGTKEKYRKIAESRGMSISRFFLVSAEEYVKNHDIKGGDDI